MIRYVTFRVFSWKFLGQGKKRRRPSSHVDVNKPQYSKNMTNQLCKKKQFSIPYPLDVALDMSISVTSQESSRLGMSHTREGERLVSDGTTPLVGKLSKSLPVSNRG